VTTAASTAIDEPWVKDFVRRKRRNGWLQIGAGVLLVILVGTAANVFAGNSDQLRKSGGRTSGVVVQLRGFSVQEDTAALIDYTVNGRRYEEKVDLGNRIRNYRLRQQVTVYYDTDAPSTMTIDDISNAPTWTTLPMAIAFVAGFVFLIVGAMGLRSNRRRRHAMEHQQWQEGATLLGARGTGLFLTLPDGRLAKAWRSAKLTPPDPASRIRVVPADKTTYVALGDASPELLEARAPRSDKEAQSWRQALDRPPPP
jgi:hypothetical protein